MIPMINFKFSIVLTILINIIKCEWVQYGNFNFNVPGHTYQITCEQNALIQGLVISNQDSNLDIWIYQTGFDLLSQNTFERITSIFTQLIYFKFVAPHMGTYYFRVYPYNMKQNLLSYNFTFGVSKPHKFITNIKQFFQSYPNKNILNINNIQTWKSLKYTIQSKIPISVLLDSQNMISPYNLTANQKFSLPSTNATYSSLSLIIQDALTSTKSLQHVSLTLYYDEHEACTNQECSSDLIPIILGASLGTTGLIIIAVMLICCFCKCKHQQNANRITIGVGIASSAQIIRIDQNIACPICLDSGCNLNLPCMHVYHKNCLKQWTKKNRECPLCQNEFLKSEVKILQMV